METATVSTSAAGAAGQTVLQQKLSESLKLEYNLLRVLFEAHKQTIRSNHRSLEKKVADVIASIENYDNWKDDAVSFLTGLVSRLRELKRRLEEDNDFQNVQAQRCWARIEHLEAAGRENLSEWSDRRVTRILVDYMLRMSYFDTAIKLAECRNIQDLVDIDIFKEAKAVTYSLTNMDVAPALAWCAENRARLKGIKSNLEFELRLQHFLELVKADSCKQAFLYARKHLAIWGSTQIQQLQHALGAMAFRKHATSTKYQDLLDPKRWDYVVDQFKREFCRSYGLTQEPLLYIYLQAGLSALKTPNCFQGTCNKNDPLSQESFRNLARPLPYLKPQNSKLVCHITKELMDAENPPMVLPNGYVYSLKAILAMVDKSSGILSCPRTGYACFAYFGNIVKAYIV